MRRPQPTKLLTPLQLMAATFAFEHYRMTNVLERDSSSYLSVRALRREYNDFRAQKFCECGRPVARVPQPTLCERCRNQLFGVAA